MGQEACVSDLISEAADDVPGIRSMRLVATGKELELEKSLGSLGEFFFYKNAIHAVDLDMNACREWQRTGRCNLGQRCKHAATHNTFHSPRYVGYSCMHAPAASGDTSPENSPSPECSPDSSRTSSPGTTSSHSSGRSSPNELLECLPECLPPAACESFNFNQPGGFQFQVTRPDFVPAHAIRQYDSHPAPRSGQQTILLSGGQSAPCEEPIPFRGHQHDTQHTLLLGQQQNGTQPPCEQMETLLLSDAQGHPHSSNMGPPWQHGNEQHHLAYQPDSDTGSPSWMNGYDQWQQPSHPEHQHQHQPQPQPQMAPPGFPQPMFYGSPHYYQQPMDQNVQNTMQYHQYNDCSQYVPPYPLFDNMYHTATA